MNDSSTLSGLTVKQVYWLGYAGLIPFVMGALLSWLVNADVHGFVLHALVAYSAVIASFLGGIYWGAAWKSQRPLTWKLMGWGVTPSVIAWVAACMQPASGLVVLGFLIIGCYFMDRAVYPSLQLQQWLTLRFRATVIASLCCFLAVASVY